MLAQEAVEPGFGEAEAVLRRGVEIADTRVPSAVERPARFFFTQSAIEVAERRRSEAEAGEVELDPASRPENSRCDVGTRHASSPTLPASDGAIGNQRTANEARRKDDAPRYLGCPPADALEEQRDRDAADLLGRLRHGRDPRFAHLGHSKSSKHAIATSPGQERPAGAGGGGAPARHTL